MKRINFFTTTKQNLALSNHNISIKTKNLLLALICCCLFIFNSVPVKSQTNSSISGYVYDENSQPLPYANVLLYHDGINNTGTTTNENGFFEIKGLKKGKYKLEIKFIGYFTEEKTINLKENENLKLKITLLTMPHELKEVKIVDMECRKSTIPRFKYKKAKCQSNTAIYVGGVTQSYEEGFQQNFNTEAYDKINDNGFKQVIYDPLSTFSVDVDRASYANVRRFINNNTMPYPDAVRIEELINYFDYEYKQPDNEAPFAIHTELSDCPWNKDNGLLMIGLKGKEIEVENIPASNLVFLIDVSGSMSNANKLPLLKSAFNILVNKLRPQDRIAIVVYAGAAGLVLPSTSGKNKKKIIAALDRLNAGGSTAGGAGINLAYKIAMENFIDNGNNRIILATDGDFNIGSSSDGEMVRLIEEKRKSGVFLSILGFGMGNYKDSKMEKISNAGNGNYAYIDNLLEAKKQLGTEIWGTLFTIAKDVKFQIEFNPKYVKEYRLVGYENRLLNKEDFNDDTKDAGEIGAGHVVTALYEIVYNDDKTKRNADIDSLEYQTIGTTKSKNMLTLKLRYKKPNENKSILITEKYSKTILYTQKPSENFYLASSVAEFGMLLRNSKHKGSATYNSALELAQKTKENDKHGYRAEYIRLLEMAQLLAGN